MAAADAQLNEVRLELLRLAMRSFRLRPVIYPGVAATLALTFKSDYSPWLIGIWWLTLTATQIGFAIFRRKFLLTEEHAADEHQWIRACTDRFWLMNIVWALIVPLFWQQDDPIQNVALLLIPIVDTIATSLVAFPRRSLYYAATMPQAAMATFMALAAEHSIFTSIGIGLVLAYIYLTRLAFHQRRTSRDALWLRKHNDDLIHALAAARDLSEAARKRAIEANEQLGRREERFRALVENSFDTIIVTDSEGRITYASPSVRTFGYRAGELSGKNVLTLLAPEQMQATLRAIENNSTHGQHGKPMEFYAPSPGGGGRWIEAFVTDQRADPNVEGYIINVRDITERKRTDTELRSQFRVLKSLAAGALLDEVVTLLARGAEETNPGARAAIFLIDGNMEKLSVCAAPGFPPSFRKDAEIFWAANRGSDFTAALRAGRRIIIPDMLAVSNVPKLREFVRIYDLRALWLQTIVSHNGHPLGAIAMFFPEPRTPGAWELAYLLNAAHLGGIAVDRRRAEQSLRRATEAAEMANRAKTKFLANMSHELRTPLNAIIGFSEIMRDGLFGPLGSERYAGYAKDIHDSGAHLLNVIDDILDISKIEAGRYVIEDQDVDIAEVLRWSIDIMRPQTSDKSQIVTLTLPPALPRLRADTRAIRQIMLNLLSNAAKFTPARGRIDVAVRLTGNGDLEFSVADTGIGIPAEKIDEVLEPFGQVDDTSARQHGGTGLGLPISKSLAELHGGSFRLESEFGHGTTAAVILPAARLYSHAEGAPLHAAASGD